MKRILRIICIMLISLIAIPAIPTQAKNYLIPWGGGSKYVHQVDSMSVLIYVDSIRAVAFNKGAKNIDAVQLYLGREQVSPDNSYVYFLRPSFGQLSSYFTPTMEDGGAQTPTSYIILEDSTTTSRYCTIEQEVPGSVNRLKITLKMASYNTNFTPLSVTASWRYSTSSASGGNSER